MKNSCDYEKGNAEIGLSPEEYGSQIDCPNQECPIRGKFFRCYYGNIDSESFTSHEESQLRLSD
jgi:hypothetical protein